MSSKYQLEIVAISYSIDMPEDWLRTKVRTDGKRYKPITTCLTISALKLKNRERFESQFYRWNQKNLNRELSEGCWSQIEGVALEWSLLYQCFYLDALSKIISRPRHKLVSSKVQAAAVQLTTPLLSLETDGGELPWTLYGRATTRTGPFKYPPLDSTWHTRYMNFDVGVEFECWIHVGIQRMCRSAKEQRYIYKSYVYIQGVKRPSNRWKIAVCYSSVLSWNIFHSSTERTKGQDVHYVVYNNSLGRWH